MSAEQLAVIDGTQTIVDDGPTGTEYALPVQIEGIVAAATAAALGPAVNALYARVVLALATDATLRGLVMYVREGADDETEALEVTVQREAGQGFTAGFALQAVVSYWQSRAGTAKREPILAALAAACAAAPPAPTLSVRERVLAALQAHLASALAGAVPRNLPRPVAPATAATVLVDGDHVVSYETAGWAQVSLGVAVELLQPNSDEAALDARIQAVQAAFRSAGTLGGLAIDVVDTAVDPEALRETFTTPMLGARLSGRVFYATPAGDPCTVAA